MRVWVQFYVSKKIINFSQFAQNQWGEGVEWEM